MAFHVPVGPWDPLMGNASHIPQATLGVTALENVSPVALPSLRQTSGEERITHLRAGPIFCFSLCASWDSPGGDQVSLMMNFLNFFHPPMLSSPIYSTAGISPPEQHWQAAGGVGGGAFEQGLEPRRPHSFLPWVPSFGLQSSSVLCRDLGRRSGPGVFRPLQPFSD